MVGKKQLRYSAELEPAKEPQTPLERQLFIAQKRVVGGKKLRSGAVSGGQTQYLLRAVIARIDLKELDQISVFTIATFYRHEYQTSLDCLPSCLQYRTHSL